MSLIRKLKTRAQNGQPVRVAVIGAGKFGSMYLSQAPRTPGIHLTAVVDLSPDRARASLARVGWDAPRFAATSLAQAKKDGSTFITDDAHAVIASDAVDIVIDATGSPAAGIAHALLCCEHRKHIIMVNVEADVLAGPYLARRAAEAGIIYSMASGDQPALIAELVDWARTIGMEVVCAGKGTKYLPVYHASTPETVWGHYGFSEAQVAGGDFNAQMFNSFLDGTKSALEMAAVANGCELSPPEDGLVFPPVGVDDLPHVLRPAADGGILPKKGMVEVVSSLERDGRPVFRDLRWGVYAVFEAPSPYVKDCFQQYGLKTDASGRYAAMYKPYHLIGLELGISVASIAVRQEATGATGEWRGDVGATAKRALRAGEKLDGEGGFTVYGKLMPTATSLRRRALPIGLAHNMVLKRDIAAGEVVSWDDVDYDASKQAVQVRRAQEDMFRRELRL
ncbi:MULTISPECIES: NAD(P)H-dependent oxidoreductase [Rubrivivax]|uniref:Gfo/Idh/MocA family oxidoreductase n=1 Tax=Rubrivivax benzoatilyticus TaxID=316997 RepID=A0ABX0HPB2_9BURK|nr:MULTISPECIES: SAF domain-containing protein [Rubrivivax]EGJ10209.1 SAF domain-containing protein [Rubrivivax benzoatilyticus JA2 = ATCC BAA-35]MCC9598489.1 SAF domain-containing protein [Rubrivivax sp. JA1055]MCC9648189.1 SAF domain-containing protein [Rubrivivax sp. JA1029]NHK96914.1 Gfo/Idh/MocA family oxidoreductase [Rubrivivax benzoatilyticus]NHL24629.1 Gfo/Idh/MocA family oxidoreductase [Rubrivivax benzoatilyticus]